MERQFTINRFHYLFPSYCCMTALCTIDWLLLHIYVCPLLPSLKYNPLHNNGNKPLKIFIIASTRKINWISIIKNTEKKINHTSTVSSFVVWSILLVTFTYQKHKALSILSMEILHELTSTSPRKWVLFSFNLVPHYE